MVSPNSMLFLAENGLDLNQWIMEGIPYTGGDRLVCGQKSIVVHSLRPLGVLARVLTLLYLHYVLTHRRMKEAEATLMALCDRSSSES